MAAGSGREDMTIGDRVRVLVGGEDTGGRFALIEIIETQGGGPPRHLHHWEDEVVYVLAGEVTFHRGADHLAGRPGTSIVLPHGREHAWRVESAEARLLVSVAPAGLEDWYRELARPDTPLEQLVTVAARHGIEITGPPPGP